MAKIETFPVEQVLDSPPVFMVTAPNPGPKTLTGTHTYIVGDNPAYVIDPGPDLPGYQAFLARWAEDRRASVRAILLTHAHPDHAPGAAPLAENVAAPIYASSAMPPAEREALKVGGTFLPGETFPVAGDVLQVIATPGHTADHVGFWLKRARVLFAGDTILGQGTTLIAPPEGDMRQYMATLEEIRRLRPRLIAPGHGPIIGDPEAKITEYVEHRREREHQLLAALEAGSATVHQLVQRVYVDIDPRLHEIAAGSVQAQLDKLQAEGRVARHDAKYQLAP